ncbi:MAG: YiiX/YebB-like N1pC/P60 family cysteine hydrolase [Pseudobdellovibrionaceae bacterium]
MNNNFRLLSILSTVLIVSPLALAQAPLAPALPMLPTVEASSLQASTDLLNDIQFVQKMVNSQEFTSDTAITKLNEIYSSAFNLDPSKLNREIMLKNGTKIIDALFRLRLSIHDKLKTFHRNNELNFKIVEAAQNVIRVTRYMQDMIGERLFADPTRKKLLHAFEGGIGHTSQNTNFTASTVQSGDVLLIRGASFNSAAIARVGDIDSQFSHAALVYVDESPQNLHTPLEDRTYVMEALVETGVGIRTWRQFVTHTGPRVSIIRNSDEGLAARAGEIMYEYIKNQPVPLKYNFTMDLNFKDTMFCSQLIYEAFWMASNGAKNINRFPSPISKSYKNLLGPIGVTAETTITPGSLEFNPDFDVVSEWVDYNFTESMRIKDMVLWKVFQWLEESNFKFTSTTFEKKMGVISHYLRGVGLLKNKLSAEMPAAAVATVFTIQRAGRVFAKQVDLLKKNNPEKVWTPKEILAAIEHFKNEEIVNKGGGVFRKWKPDYSRLNDTIKSCTQIFAP